MSAPETPFTDRSAVVRGLQIAQQKAPLFAAHIESIRENMLKTAEQCAKLDFLLTAKAMREVARGL